MSFMLISGGLAAFITKRARPKGGLNWPIERHRRIRIHTQTGSRPKVFTMGM